jgi:hypothetical protein
MMAPQQNVQFFEEEISGYYVTKYIDRWRQRGGGGEREKFQQILRLKIICYNA